MSDWLGKLLSHPNVNINNIAYYLNGLAQPGKLRDAIDNQVRNCLNDENPVVVTNALNLLAGVEGFSTRFTVPNVKDKVTELLNSDNLAIATQAKRAMQRIDSSWVQEENSSSK